MNKKWRTEQMSPQRGKVAIVTGVNNELGYEPALGLAKKDVGVILACRNRQKAEEAKSKIVK